VFFQVFVWSMATILWRVVDQETRLSDYLCIAIGTTGVSTLFNLCPLMKFDGYYLLVDHLGIFNLRRRAFDHLRGKLASWFRPAVEKTAAEIAKTAAITKREKKIYWAYGLTAGVFSIGVLGFVFWKAADYLFRNFQGTGLLFLAGAVFVGLTSSSERWGLGIRNAFKGGKWFGVRRTRWRTFLGVLVLALIVIVFAKWELKVSNKAHLLPSSRASVRADVDGTIREILVDEGDTVSAGAMLARLDDAGYRAEMNEAEAEIAKWSAELELLERGPLAEDVTSLEKLVEKEKTKVAFAVKEYERARELSEKNLVAPTEFEEASENLDVARMDLEHAESELAALLASSRPEKIRAAKAEVERLQSSHEFYREQVARTRIVSPIRGIVSTHLLKEKVGEFVEAGDEICEIVDCQTMLLEIPVSEKDVTDVRVGQRVKFRARSIPKIAFHGRVSAIAPVAGKNTDRTVVIITSRVENPGLILRSGMTGNAKIYCGKRRIIDLWTRKVIRFVRVEFWW